MRFGQCNMHYPFSWVGINANIIYGNSCIIRKCINDTPTGIDTFALGNFNGKLSRSGNIIYTSSSGGFDGGGAGGDF